MKSRLALALLAGVASFLHAAPCGAQQPSASRPAFVLRPDTARVVAFVNVTVLPMDRERRLPAQTVVVRDGRIVAVGPVARTRVPAGARRIDGTGRFLLPGLAEMHAHVPPTAATEQGIADLMLLYVANGVTTIRGMLGAPYQLALRERLATGALVGPTLYVGAPSINGNSAPTADSAVKLVRAHAAAGYDFLKIHPGLSRAAYDAMARTAREVGLTWGGHVPQDVGVRHAIASGQATIDHLDGYLEDALTDSVRAELARPSVQFPWVVRAVDERRFGELARLAREAGTWNVPTAFLWESMFDAVPIDSALARPEMQYVSPAQRAAWRRQKEQMLASAARQGVSAADVTRFLALRRQLLKTLADSAAPLLMGTDSPQLFNVPGFALHRELQVAIAAGLTPWQVLQSGTANVARYARASLKRDDDFGTVAPGQRADLVLLDADPLLDVANLARRAGVMVRGRWLPAAELQRGLDELATRNREK